MNKFQLSYIKVENDVTNGSCNGCIFRDDDLGCERARFISPCEGNDYWILDDVTED